MIDSLYYFDDNLFINKQALGLSSSMSSIFVHDQIMFLHLRLGHPSFPYLKHLFSSLFKNLECAFFIVKVVIYQKVIKFPTNQNLIMLQNPFI